MAPNLISVSPDKCVEFPAVLHTSLTANLQIKNLSNDFVNFKVKTTAPKNYLVRPSAGVISAKGSSEVQIVLQPLKTDGDIETSQSHRFLIQAVEIPDGNLIDKEHWASISREAIQDHKLSVSFRQTEGGSGTTTTTEAIKASGEESGEKLQVNYDKLVLHAISLEKENKKLLMELESIQRSSAIKGRSAGGKYSTLQVLMMLMATVIIMKVMQYF